MQNSESSFQGLKSPKENKLSVHSSLNTLEKPSQTQNFFLQYSQKREENFQLEFSFLEEYLGKVLEDHNYKFSTGSQEEEKISMAKAKAKEYFKNCAFEIFRSMKQKFQDQQLHHILPESYLKMSIEQVKNSISSSLDQLTEKIIEFTSKGITPLDKQSIMIKKKKKKGKTKIPKKALTTLKNWLTENFQDPYPSHAEKIRIANEAGITLKQVQNWFTNARGRIWRKSNNEEKFTSQIELKLKEETK